jgi:hypothetical protein
LRKDWKSFFTAASSACRSCGAIDDIDTRQTDSISRGSVSILIW